MLLVVMATVYISPWAFSVYCAVRRALRHRKRYAHAPSPLPAVLWWRVSRLEWNRDLAYFTYLLLFILYRFVSMRPRWLRVLMQRYVYGVCVGGGGGGRMKVRGREGILSDQPLQKKKFCKPATIMMSQ